MFAAKVSRAAGNRTRTTHTPCVHTTTMLQPDMARVYQIALFFGAYPLLQGQYTFWIFFALLQNISKALKNETIRF